MYVYLTVASEILYFRNTFFSFTCLCIVLPSTIAPFWLIFHPTALFLALNLKKEELFLLRLSKSSDLWEEKKLQRKRKCSLLSISVLQEHIGLIASSKPCLDLCSFRWLNCRLRHVRRFTPTGLSTEKRGFPCERNSKQGMYLNFLALSKPL